jgi:cytidine deaminase
MDERTERDLIQAARAVRGHAHVPVSGIRVGAALLGASGRIHTGANVETSVLQAICAERAALAVAVAQGEHVFRAVAVVTDFDPPWAPCGICRQVLSDFGLDLPVVMAHATSGAIRRATLGELLPLAVQDTALLAAAQRADAARQADAAHQADDGDVTGSAVSPGT